MPKLYPLFGMLSFLLLAGTASGQPLDTLIARAYRNNPDLRMSRLQYEAAMERRGQVNELPNPEFGLGVFLLPIQTRLGPQRLRLSATQRLPWMGSLEAREDLALARAREAYLQEDLLSLDLDFAIREAYYRLYEIRQTQAIIRRSLALYRSLEDYALAQVENGEGSTAEVLRVQLRIQAAEQDIRRLENERNAPLSRLNQALNRPLATPVDIPDTLAFAPIALNRDTVGNYLQNYHPRLRQLDLQEAVAQREIDLNDLNARPSFSVGLDYIMLGKRPDMDVEGSGRDALMIRGSLTVPIFQKSFEAREREERLRIDALQHQKTSWENRYLAELEQAYVQYRDAQLQLELYLEQGRTLDSAIDILLAEYSNEGTGLDELLDLYLQQSELDQGTLEAVVQSYMARAAIHRLVPLN